MDYNVINGAFAASGAAAWGAVAFARLAGVMTPEARETALSLCPEARTVLVAAFPYFNGETAGNLSVYARGRDYHLVLGQRLNAICTLLRQNNPEYLFIPGVDSSPLPEREAAWLAGLGLRGRNGLVILPPYGSYVFLGTVLTDAPWAYAAPPAAPGCMACGKCAAACPGGALGEEGFHPDRCLSALTQRKGDLTGEETAHLRAHPYVWGCDICQTVCPYNQGVQIGPLDEFCEGYLSTLTAPMVDNLTNKTFRQRFGDRAFAWRGLAVLKRNLKLKDD